MKKALALTLVCLIAIALPAQQPQNQPPGAPPDVSGALANIGSIGETLLLYKVWVENNFVGLWAAHATVSSTAGQNTTDITKLQDRVAALEAKLKAAPPPSASPLHVEAESLTTSSPVATLQPTETSTTNKNLCCMTAAVTGTADYNVTIPADGNYVVTVRAATTRDGLTVALSSGAVTTGPIPVVNTGGWQTYTILTGATPLALKAGAQTIRLTYAQYVNIDYFELTLQ